jgi:hypothetical protein
VRLGILTPILDYGIVIHRVSLPADGYLRFALCHGQ